MNPLMFLLPLLSTLKPNPAKVNRAKLKEHLTGLVDVALKSNDAKWDDAFEGQINDVIESAVDQFLGPQTDEPIPMGASPGDTNKIIQIAQAKGVSPAIISLLIQFSLPFALKLLKKWFPDLDV